MSEQQRDETFDEEVGEPIDVKAVILPKVMVVNMEIDGVHFIVSIPHKRFDYLETAVCAFPEAFMAVLRASAGEDDDDE